jgi:hypothetical protein
MGEGDEGGSRMPKREARIVVRFEYTAGDAEDIQTGLKVWAAFITERLRQSTRDPNRAHKEGRPT